MPSIHEIASRPTSQSLLAAIVESSDDAIVSKTLDGVITSWNAGAERLFGFTAAEAVGQHVTIVIPPDHRQEERLILDRLRRGERIEHLTTVRQRKDGSRFDVSLTVSPIRDDDGRIIGASKVARDITALKRTERALQEADRRKNEFLALLAHELRNPLGPIRHAVSILRSKAAAADAEWATGVIDRQVRHMTRLVDDLLDVSRISRGTVALRRERVDIATVIAHAVETTRAAIDKAGHRVTLDLPEAPLHVDGDATRLTQIVANLLDNAVKYTDPGGRVGVTVHREGEEVVIVVTDTGIGIEPDVLPRVFDLFAQAELSIERSEGGLGVGLALVERLVQLHGGSVAARSEGAGTGSTFTVRLPVATAGGERGRRPAHQQGVPERFVRRRVLVVDDNRDSADSLAMLLQLMGHETRTAHEGLEALTVAASFRPDVVLLDIGLPTLSGYDVARRMRQQPDGTHVLLVALTGWGQDEHRRRSRDAGFDHHLTKPVDIDALERILASGARSRPPIFLP